MTTTHTPGPWAIIADVPGHEIGYRAIVAVDDGELAETICNPSPMGAANARLIAAAPDLLAALQYALERFECIPEHRDEIGLYRTGARLARAAIAKATA